MDLILGIDLCENNTQVSYYFEKDNDIVSVPFSGNRMIIENDQPLSSVISEIANGNPDVKEAYKKYIIGLLDNAVHHTTIENIAWIGVTLENYHIDALDVLKQIFTELGFGKKVSFISHEESFCNYVVTTKKELWNSGCALIDFSSKGLKFSLLNNARIPEGNVITVNSTDIAAKEVKQILAGELDLKDASDFLVQVTNENFGKQIVSSVYLTGAIFDKFELPKEYTQFLCSKRRAFAGQNLFVKGACIEAAIKAKAFDMSEYIFACANRLTATIEMDIVEKGVPMKFRIAKAGNNWYASTRVFDCILNATEAVSLRVTNLGAKDSKSISISLDEIPKRPAKTTRVEIGFSFKGADRCLVTIKDKGFGEFFKSSGTVIHRELEL